MRLRSPHGQAILRARITDAVQPGHLFAPIHWTGETAPAARIDTLVTAATDPVSGQPESKASVVAAEWFAAYPDGTQHAIRFGDDGSFRVLVIIEGRMSHVVSLDRSGLLRESVILHNAGETELDRAVEMHRFSGVEDMAAVVAAEFGEGSYTSALILHRLGAAARTEAAVP